MDIRHIQKYEYIPVNVHKNNLKCGKSLRSRWRGWWKTFPIDAIEELCTNFTEEIDEAGMRAITVNNCAEGRELRWCVFRIFQAYRGESRARLIRFEQAETKVKPSSVHRENLCLHDAGKPRLPRKAAAAAAAILCQFIREQSQITEKRTEWRTTIPGWQTCRQHSFETHLQVRLLRHHDKRHNEEARATHWNVILPILREKFQNQLEGGFTWKDWSHWFLPQKLRKQSIKSMKMKMENWATFVRSKHNQEK